jgi:Na+/melibiose symporter-like transporter
MALAMGTQVAIARLGVFAVFTLSPRVAGLAPESVMRPVAIVGLLLCIGFLTYLVFTFMDRKLDRQLDAVGEGPSEEFKVSDLGKLFSGQAFMIVALLCVVYYSAIFPFQKFAVSMFQNSDMGLSAQQASDIFRWFPIGAMVLTPFLGAFLDFRGKGATMLILGAILMSACHLTFALVPLTKTVAYVALILLGVSFSLVPAALWPSVPKLVENRYLGSGYGVIFWIQNIGLWGFPVIIGAALQAANPGVSEQIQAGVEVTYNYTVPMLIFASLGVVAFLLGLWLKVLDRKKGYGLELPNVAR